MNSAGDTDVACDRLAKSGKPTWITVIKMLPTQSCPLPAHETHPITQRKHIQRRATGMELAWNGASRAGDNQCRHRRASLRQRGELCGISRAIAFSSDRRVHVSVRDSVDDEIPGAAASDQIPLRVQSLQRSHHRDAGNRQCLREVPRRGEPDTGREGPVDDCSADGAA